MDRLFQIYKRMLELHIQTKVVDHTFHQASEDFYSTLFDVFHTISEKRQDIELDIPMDCDKAKQEAYDIIEEAKSIIEKMVGSKNSIGMDNLLRGLLDKLEFDCGTARSFLDDDMETDMQPTAKGLKPKYK